MSLIIKDGNNTAKTLKTTVDSSEHVAHHIIDSVGSTVTVSASAASPVYVTGSVQISQPVNVDLVVGDLFYVTSSQVNPVWTTGTVHFDNASIGISGTPTITGTVHFDNTSIQISNTPTVTGTVHFDNASIGISGTPTITGTVHIDNSSVYVTSSGVSPVWVTGTVSTTIGSISVADGLRVTSSLADPIYVSSSIANPVAVHITNYVGGVTEVTSSGTNPVFISSSNPIGVSFSTVPTITGTVHVDNSYLYVSSSQANPIWITGTVAPAVTATVNISATASVGATVTASIYGSPASSFGKSKYRVGDTVSYDSNTSGTFQLAAVSSTRKGLVVHNPSSTKLYITLGSGTLNGFDNVMDLQDEPNIYSFILYPSGTYTADLSLVNLFHGGWFVSSSAVNGSSVFVTTTE